MSCLSRAIARNPVLTLPRATDSEGGIRRIGIELELGGLSAAAAAAVAQQTLGGEIDMVSRQEYRLEGSAIGTVKIYLDTAFRDHADSRAGQLGLDLARRVVPVELVTEPLTPQQLARCEDLREALRDAGAIGSRNGPFLGFALHLNPALSGRTAADIVPVACAFALLEDWLRGADPLDVTRRLLPFAHPYPRRFVDVLAATFGIEELEPFWALYLQHNATRNRGLDLLPILTALDPERLTPLRDQLGKITPRPAFHYRVPDSRVDERGWSIGYELGRWAVVERLAGMQPELAALCLDWRDHRAALTTTPRNWRMHTEAFLRHHVMPGLA
ncbi:amidoligase family protein [Plastorhodobacter daqingensis]|uniref:Amidoligase family protein n=1 Tax=Plastorhodobacter daqingensis TaxID=1387281 RepID=A0ABW2UM99_9RHOB